MLNIPPAQYQGADRLSGPLFSQKLAYAMTTEEATTSTMRRGARDLPGCWSLQVGPESGGERHQRPDDFPARHRMPAPRQAQLRYQQ